MNLFYDLPTEIQVLIYEYEGNKKDNFKLVISEIDYNYYYYDRLFGRIKNHYSFSKWFKKRAI